jgi:hypothetical protein
MVTRPFTEITAVDGSRMNVAAGVATEKTGTTSVLATKAKPTLGS